MYKVIVTIDNTDYTIQDNTKVVIEPLLTQTINSADTFEFNVHKKEFELYNDMAELNTLVSVYDEWNVLQFKGRMINQYNYFNGLIKYTFEGELAYLNDIQYPPYEFNGDIPELLKDVLDYYNANCDESKKIEYGTITVTDLNNYITRSNEDYSSCWKVINDKLVESLGGYLVLRYEGDTRYLDYLAEPPRTNNQTIEFGKNLLDLEDYIDATTLATVLIPLGAEDEDGNRITVASVNDDSIYVESNLIDTYGRIEQVNTWDDVTLPENLLTKAQEYVNQMILKEQTITVRTIDLGFTDEEIARFRKGDKVICKSEPHNLEIELVITEIQNHINSVQDNEISIGTQAGFATI